MRILRTKREGCLGTVTLNGYLLEGEYITANIFTFIRGGVSLVKCKILGNALQVTATFVSMLHLLAC